MSHEPDWRALDRYLAGTASPAEVDVVRRWLAEHPGEAALLQSLPPALTAAEPTWDTGAAWEHMAASLPALEQAPKQRPVLTLQPRRRVWPRLVAGATLAAAALSGIVLWRAGAFTAAGAPPVLAELTTPAGRRATIRLEDGTTVRLDAGSRLRYPRRLAAGAKGAARELYLDGRAFFRVKHDRARPFVVHAGGTLVRDLGTEFGVTAYRGSPAVQVVVAQGEVSVRGRAGERTVTPGQLASVDKDGIVEVRAVDPRAWLAWTDGVLSFEERPLSDVLPELSHWYGAEIRVTDTALAHRPLTAELRGDRGDRGDRGESLEQALDAIALALGARWHRDGSGYVLERGDRP